MKSTFGRMFALIASVILLCLILVGRKYLEREGYEL